MKGWRLFCLIAFPLTICLAEETLTSNDLKSGNHSVEMNENEGSKSGAVAESGESEETMAKSETNALLKSSDDAEEATNSDASELSDTKRSWPNKFNGKDLLQNNLRPGYFAPKGHIINQPSSVYLGSAPANGQLVTNNEHLKILLTHDKSSPPEYSGADGVHDKNEYEYSPNPNVNVQNANQVLTYGGFPSSDMYTNQVLISGSKNQGMKQISSIDEEDQGDSESNAYSRVIPHNERILLHKIPGASNLLTCSREGEFHNFWSSTYQCLVCACIRDDGLLRPVCASCSGCMAPHTGIVEVPEILEGPEVDIPDKPTQMPTIPRITDTTAQPMIEDEVTCSPLPSGQPFDNPLHPCQVCICIESFNMYGKPDVHIKCQENPQCVLPTDATVIPSIPDVPVPSPYCDKFPLNVLFPHPSDGCKTCQCSVQVSQLGISEKLITCLPNPDCSSNNPGPEIITEPPGTHPVTPYYPIPVEPQVVLIPATPEPVPIFEIDTIKPSPWTPATEAPLGPSPPGPLPGPSPHDSCRPYVSNQPFQHPWDECQMCVCTEAFSKQHITIEVNCFTKKSCCIEPPFDMVTAISPIPNKQTGKIKILDAICEYKTFGVEFKHPHDPCKICTCELQGHLITPLCKRSSKRECQLVSVYPTATVTFKELAQGHSHLPPGSQLSPVSQFLPGSQLLPVSSFNAASSSSQNKAMKNAFVSYQNPYESSGKQTMGSSQSSADQKASSYNQWNQQNLQRPEDFNYRTKNVQGSASLQLGSQRPGDLVYGSQNLNRPGNQYSNGGGYYGGGSGLQGNGLPKLIQGRPYQAQSGVYSQNYPGYFNYGQGYPGYPPGLRPTEVISQAQTKASASATSSGLQNTFAYSPGYQSSDIPEKGNTGLNKAKIEQFAQSSASAQSNAQASSMSTIKYRGRSGKPDDNESSVKEN